MITAGSSASSRVETAAAFALGMVALMMIGLQPVLLGEMVAQQQVTLSGVGIIAMGEIFAMGIGIVLAEKLLPLNRLRLIAAVAALLLVTINLLETGLSGDTAHELIRALAGLVEGVLFWLTTGVIVRSQFPDRLAGIFLAVDPLSQALVVLLLARIFIPHWGWEAGFVVLAAVSLLALLVAPILPSRLTALRDENAPASKSPKGVFALALVFTQMCATGALWAYMEPLGRAAGLTAKDAQTVIAAVLILQIMGAAVAALLVRRLSAPYTLATGALMLIAIALTMYQLPNNSETVFAGLCVAFGFLWQFLLPFQIRLALNVDPVGRVAMLVPAAQLLGSAFGPLMASFSVSGDSADRVPLVAIGFAFMGLTALLALRYKTRRLVPCVL